MGNEVRQPVRGKRYLIGLKALALAVATILIYTGDVDCLSG